MKSEEGNRYVIYRSIIEPEIQIKEKELIGIFQHGQRRERKESASRAGVAPRSGRPGLEVRFFCGGGGNGVTGRNCLPRHERGKDSSRYFESGSGFLARLRRGKVRPGFGAQAFFAAVRVVADYRGVKRSSGEGERGLMFLFTVSCHRSFPRCGSSGRDVQVKGSGGPAGRSEPVRVVPYRKLAFPATEARATWQVAIVSVKVRVRAQRRRARTRRRRENTHTHPHFFSIFSRVGDPGRFLFCPTFSIPHTVREDAIN